MKATGLCIVIGCFLLSGCRSDVIQENCSPVRLATDLNTLTSVDLFTIQEVRSTESTLTVKFSYGGGCDPNHQFDLYVQPLHSTAIQAFEGRVIFSTKDACKRLDTKEFCFDMTTLKNKYPSGGIIQLKGFKEPISF